VPLGVRRDLANCAAEADQDAQGPDEIARHRGRIGRGRPHDRPTRVNGGRVPSGVMCD
jgi:hypothetical protein